MSPYGQASGQGYNNPRLVQLIIVTGTPNSGIFLYSPEPGAGNLVGSWTTMSGTDRYGNSYPAGIDDQQNLLVGITGQSTVGIDPDIDQAFDVTAAISGIIQSAIQFTTTDASELLPGILGSLLLNTGSNTKMSTVLGSPLGNSAGASSAYMVLESQNDGGTDTPVITFGTVITPDDGTTLTYTPILTLTPYALLVYGGQSGQTVVTHTSGTGNIPIPADAISPAKGEAWGAGASLAGISGGTSAIGGCGSAGYSQEPALAITPGGTVPYSVPASANALGGTPPDCTLTGTAVTVTAHSGTGGTTAGSGAGAPASSNTVAYPGARGGNPSFHSPGGGGGGGGAAGPGGAGNAGSAGSPSQGGGGGVGASGAGNGGKGGNPSQNGAVGLSPGGGGAGGGTNADGAIGGHGQVRLTYSTGAPAILLSVANAAGTDQFGTNYPAGTQVNLADDGTSYVFGENVMHNTSAQTISSTSNVGITGLSQTVAAGGTYEFSGIFRVKQGTVNVAQKIGFTGPAVSFVVWYFWGANAGAASMGAPDVVGSLAPQSITFSAASIESYQFFEGIVTFSAGGIFQGAAAEGTTGDTFTIQPGCIMRVRRVS